MHQAWFRFYEELNDFLPLRVTRFILDVHLGKLAKYLRLCGFDSLFNTGLNDIQIIELSLKELRIILTRDKGLLKNKRVTHGFWIRSSDPAEQTRDVIRKFDLKNSVNPFTRCLECNGMLTDASKEEILDKLPPKTREFYDKFKKCQGCGKIYWEGSHYERMNLFIQSVTCF